MFELKEFVEKNMPQGGDVTFDLSQDRDQVVIVKGVVREVFK